MRKTLAGALTSVLLHIPFALAPSPWSRGRGQPDYLRISPVLTQLECEARILLEHDLAFWLQGAFYGILRLPIHFAVKMASGSGVGVGLRRFEGSGVAFQS